MCSEKASGPKAAAGLKVVGAEGRRAINRYCHVFTMLRLLTDKLRGIIVLKLSSLYNQRRTLNHSHA